MSKKKSKNKKNTAAKTTAAVNQQPAKKPAEAKPAAASSKKDEAPVQQDNPNDLATELLADISRACSPKEGGQESASKDEDKKPQESMKQDKTPANASHDVPLDMSSDEKEIKAIIAKNVQEMQDKKTPKKKDKDTPVTAAVAPAVVPAKKKAVDKPTKKRAACFIAATVGIAVLLGVGIKLSGTLSAPKADNTVEPTPPPIITTAPGDVARDPVDGLPEKSHVHGQYVAAEENTQYATIKSPEVGLEAPLFYGDTQEILKVSAFGQSTKTPQVGNLSSHLICTYDEDLSAKVLQMEAGDRFCIETNYGSYVYSVTSSTEGKINRKTGYIESVDGENLFRLDDETQDTVYIYTDDAEHNKHVVVGVLIE